MVARRSALHVRCHLWAIVPRSTGRSSERHGSNRNDVDQVLDPDKTPGIAGVEPSSVGIRCRRDQQVHHPRSRLTTGVGDSRRELAVTDRDVFVDRKSVELSVEVREPPQAFRPLLTQPQGPSLGAM